MLTMLALRTSVPSFLRCQKKYLGSLLGRVRTSSATHKGIGTENCFLVLWRLLYTCCPIRRVTSRQTTSPIDIPDQRISRRIARAFNRRSPGQPGTKSTAAIKVSICSCVRGTTSVGSIFPFHEGHGLLVTRSFSTHQLKKVRSTDQCTLRLEEFLFLYFQ